MTQSLLPKTEINLRSLIKQERFIESVERIANKCKLMIYGSKDEDIKRDGISEIIIEEQQQQSNTQSTKNYLISLIDY